MSTANNHHYINVNKFIAANSSYKNFVGDVPKRRLSNTHHHYSYTSDMITVQKL